MRAICFILSIILLFCGVMAVYTKEDAAASLFAFGFAFLLVGFLIKKKKPFSAPDQKQAVLDRIEDQPADDPCVDEDTDAYIAFDLETTGLSSYSDRIIEIGAVKVVNSEIVGEFSQLVDPGCPIPADVSAINHITDDMVAVQPRPQEPEIIRPRVMDGMAFLKSHAGHYVAFDLETTGLSPQSDAIIEIGAVKVKDGEIVETFSTFVHPGRHIPEAATAVNHITDDMVSGAPGIALALPLFQAFVGNLPCVAHNCGFDSGFLAASGMDPLPSFADSLQMARRLFPGLPNKKLATVCEAIGYEIGQAHRALDDAKAVRAIVQACDARAASLEEGERARKRHDKLTIAINQAYSVARESADPSPAQMDGILSMCREDFALVPAVREYCAMNAYPDPVFDSFRRAAIILAQRKDYDAAIQVCDQALGLNIPDPTMEGGMAARRDRLIRQRETARAKEAEAQEKEALRAEKRRAREEREKEKKACPSNQKAVLQYSYDGEILIKAHESIAAAAREIGINSSCIRDALNGKQKHAGGFTWKRGEAPLSVR